MNDEPAKIMRLSWSVIFSVMAVEAAAFAVLIGGAGLVWGLTQQSRRDMVLDSRGETAKVMAEINAEMTKQVDAWNRGDLDGYMAGYWKSDKLTFYSGGDTTSGWQPTLDRYRKRYQAKDKAMGKLAFSVVVVNVLTADDAYVRGRWKLDLPDKTAPEGLFTLIVKRIDGNWRIVHDHTSVKAP
jgi:ketosteroid isomerase-like protein